MRIGFRTSFQSDAKSVVDFARKKIDLNSVVEDRVFYFVDGKSHSKTNPYVLKDFFDSIELKESEQSIQLLFDIRPGANHYWGDVVVDIVRAIVKKTASPAFFFKPGDN